MKHFRLTDLVIHMRAVQYDTHITVLDIGEMYLKIFTHDMIHLYFGIYVSNVRSSVPSEAKW